jgi:hypothetical protein
MNLSKTIVKCYTNHVRHRPLVLLGDLNQIIEVQIGEIEIDPFHKT